MTQLVIPPIPFACPTLIADYILSIEQAKVEKFHLLTVNKTVIQYGDPVFNVDTNHF